MPILGRIMLGFFVLTGLFLIAAGVSEWEREGYLGVLIGGFILGFPIWLLVARARQRRTGMAPASQLSPPNAVAPPLPAREPSLAPPSQEAEIEALKKQYDWFAITQTLDGQRRLCVKKQVADTLRRDVLDGVLNGASLVEIHAKSQDGKWVKTSSPLAQFAKGHFKLRVLYEPVWAHAMAGVKWGVLTGIGLKFLDTLILLASVNGKLAVMFLIVAGVCAIPRVGMPAMIAVSFAMWKFANVNLFLAVVAVMLIGSILGSLPGMAIGGAIGLVRKKNLPLAGDAQPERRALFVKAVLLPLAGGAGLWAFYLLVFNPWLMTVMSKP